MNIYDLQKVFATNPPRNLDLFVSSLLKVDLHLAYEKPRNLNRIMFFNFRFSEIDSSTGWYG